MMYTANIAYCFYKQYISCFLICGFQTPFAPARLGRRVARAPRPPKHAGELRFATVFVKAQQGLEHGYSMLEL